MNYYHGSTGTSLPWVSNSAPSSSRYIPAASQQLDGSQGYPFMGAPASSLNSANIHTRNPPNRNLSSGSNYFSTVRPRGIYPGGTYPGLDRSQPGGNPGSICRSHHYSMTYSQPPRPPDSTRLLWTSGQPPFSYWGTGTSRGWPIPVQVGANPQVMSHLNTSSHSIHPPPPWPYPGQVRQTSLFYPEKPPRMKTQPGNTRFDWMSEKDKRERANSLYPQGSPASVWVIDQASRWQSACTSCVANRTACTFTAPDKQFCTACRARPSHCEIAPKPAPQRGGVGLGAAPYGL